LLSGYGREKGVPLDDSVFDLAADCSEMDRLSSIMMVVRGSVSMWWDWIKAALRISVQLRTKGGEDCIPTCSVVFNLMVNGNEIDGSL